MLAKIIYWLPRAIFIIYAILLGVFTFDMKWGFNITNLIPILIHSLPAIIVIVTIIISWKKEALWAMIFAILGAIFTLFFQTYENIEIFFIISLPLFLGSILFYMNHLRSKMKWILIEKK